MGILTLFSAQTVLNEMLRVQLTYHCQALELLTSSFEHLANLDVQASVEVRSDAVHVRSILTERSIVF